MRPKYDILWKGMIEEVMDDLLLFVEPGIGKDLDLGRGFVFLVRSLRKSIPSRISQQRPEWLKSWLRRFCAKGRSAGCSYIWSPGK